MAKIPEGFHTITPQITVSNGDKAIALYKKALDAKEIGRMLLPGTDKIMHAQLQIGTSKLFLSDLSVQRQKKQLRGVGSSFYIYVTDVDAAHERAVEAGMSEMMPPTDMFWGDRMSAVDDRYGHRWCFATQVREVSRNEMMEAAKQQFGSGKLDKKSGKKGKDKGKKDKDGKSRKEPKVSKSEDTKRDKKKDKQKKK